MKHDQGKSIALALLLIVLIALALLWAVPGVLAIHTIVLPPG